MTTLRRILALAAVVFASTRSTAADEDPVLSRAAYAAILKADELANLKIGVKAFTDGSAMLWGSASPADAAKAEGVLKKVPGIKSVLNTCEPLAGPATATPAEGPVLIPPPGIAVDRPTTIERKADGPAARLLDPRPEDGPIDYAAVERVRRGDPRFSRLTFDLRDGRVVIGGAAADPRAAWDLARQIAPLVGNRDVVVVRPR
jgi:hypothetical protein